MHPASTLLAAHRANLETLIELNAAARVDRPARLLLDGITEQARRYLRRVAGAEAEMARDASFFGPLVMGELGPNGRGPTIRDLCRQGEYHRAAGRRVPVLEAAE